MRRGFQLHVARTGWQDQTVTLRNVQGLPIRPANLQRRFTAPHAQRFMRAAVVMVIGKHTIAPDAASSVSCEQCLESSGIEWRADLSIDDDREGLVVGNLIAWI